MRKLVGIFLVFLLSLSLIACSDASESDMATYEWEDAPLSFVHSDEWIIEDLGEDVLGLKNREAFDASALDFEEGDGFITFLIEPIGEEDAQPMLTAYRAFIDSIGSAYLLDDPYSFQLQEKNASRFTYQHPQNEKSLIGYVTMVELSDAELLTVIGIIENSANEEFSTEYEALIDSVSFE